VSIISLRFYLWALLGLMIGLAGSGCDIANTGPTPTPTPSLSATEIANRSSQAMLDVKTLHFDIELTGKLAYIDRPPTTALKRVEGKLLRPDRVQALVRVSTLGLVSEVGLISIAGESYVTNPINQRWELLPPEWGWFFDPRLPFDEQYGIPAVVPLITFENKGVEEIEGQSYYHLAGVAQGQQITWWTAGLIADSEVPVNLWINTDTFLIQRVHLVELNSDPERPTEWTILFTNYDQPLTIESPPIE
jgi:hypothetical protein